MIFRNQHPDRPPNEGWMLVRTVTETTTHTHTTEERVAVLPLSAPRSDSKRDGDGLLTLLEKALRWLVVALGALTCCS